MSQQTISRYLIYSELDRGGMAIVYHAHDPNFDRDVAIKVLPSQFLHDRTFRARFQREAQAVAMLEHTAIVPVYDFGEENGQMYLVMRYMTGGSLADRIATEPMALTEVARIIGRLAPALDRAHDLGVIHRDLKPANILFDGDGEAYITDFGIARLAEATVELTASNVIVGTPAYMSPEQARDSSEIDGRADIYSLGVIVFQMLTARLPYQAHSSVGYLTAHVTDPVPNILDYNPDLPPSCRTIINKSMAKDVSERYQLAHELAADLKLAADASHNADTLRASLHEADMSTVSRGATRRVPLPDYTYDQIKPPEIAYARKPHRAPRRWNMLWAWLAGSILALLLLCGILIALNVFDNTYPLFAQATNTPSFLPIEGHTKVATQTPAPTLTLTTIPTITIPIPTNTSMATSVQPTKAPTATYTPSPTYTITPSPTATVTPPPGTEHGLTDIKFGLTKLYLAPDETIVYSFSIKNSNPDLLSYGVLGAEILYSSGEYYFIDRSFQDGMLAPSQVLTKTDDFVVSSPGTYKAQLIICYDTLEVCNSDAGDKQWERLSPPITFIIYPGTPTLTMTP